MLRNFVTYIVENLLKINMNTRFGESIHFLIYDTIKILLLLSIMIFFISFIRSFFPPEKVKDTITKMKGIKSYFFAALLGVVSPFCSCSTVPIFIGFVETGIPLGVTFTFLITSPIVNEIALIWLFAEFGPLVAIVYTIAGITIGMVSGMIIEKLNLNHLIEPSVFEMHSKNRLSTNMTFQGRISFSIYSVKEIFQRVWKFVIIGISIGALIHGYMPEDLIVKYAGPNNPFAVFAAVVLGIPLYSNAAGTIPIIEALMNKGIGVGTALAFFMSVVALSLPEMILLKKVIKTKLIGIFVLITGIAILFTGYLFNLIL